MLHLTDFPSGELQALPWAKEWLEWVYHVNHCSGRGPSDSDPGDEAIGPRLGAYELCKFYGVPYARAYNPKDALSIWQEADRLLDEALAVLHLPPEYASQKVPVGLLRMDGIKDF